MTFIQALVVVSCGVILFVEWEWRAAGKRRIEEAAAAYERRAMALDLATADIDQIVNDLRAELQIARADRRA